MAWLAAMRLLLMEETFAIWTQCNVCHLKLAIKDKHDRINSGPYGKCVELELCQSRHSSSCAHFAYGPLFISIV